MTKYHHCIAIEAKASSANTWKLKQCLFFSLRDTQFQITLLKFT